MYMDIVNKKYKRDFTTTRQARKEGLTSYALRICNWRTSDNHSKIS